MKRPRDDPNQLPIDWNPSPQPVNAAKAHVAPAAAEAPVQRLSWDFSTSFPQPTDEALDAGVIDATDLEAGNLRGLHREHARQALSVLSALDAVLDARRRGVDPQTGKPPRTPQSKEQLRCFFEAGPLRLERSFQALIDVDENGFGVEAAEAFAKAIRAWHAGVQMVADQPTAGKPPGQRKGWSWSRSGSNSIRRSTTWRSHVRRRRSSIRTPRTRSSWRPTSPPTPACRKWR